MKVYKKNDSFIIWDFGRICICINSFLTHRINWLSAGGERGKVQRARFPPFSLANNLNWSIHLPSLHGFPKLGEFVLLVLHPSPDYLKWSIHLAGLPPLPGLPELEYTFGRFAIPS